MIINETFTLPFHAGLTLNVVPAKGYFAYFNAQGKSFSQIYDCRDSFCSMWSRSEYIEYLLNQSFVLVFAANKNINLQSVEEFFNLVETKLKVLPANRTKFQVTNFANQIVFTPAVFWTKDNIRKSLFSLLLRCAIVHYTGNFDAAINNYNLAAQCKNFINFFLEGNTFVRQGYEITDDHARRAIGVVARFGGLSLDTLKNQLYIPKKKKIRAEEGAKEKAV